MDKQIRAWRTGAAHSELKLALQPQLAGLADHRAGNTRDIRHKLRLARLFVPELDPERSVRLSPPVPRAQRPHLGRRVAECVLDEVGGVLARLMLVEIDDDRA